MIRPAVEVLLSMVDNLSAPLRSTAQGVQGIAAGISSAVKGMAAAALGYVTADFFKDSIEEAMNAEVATSRLALAVGNAGGAFSEWGPQIDESIGRLTKLTRFGDDDFKAAMTNMVAKSGDVKGSLGNMGLAADVAAMKGISLADAGDLVGKVMAGNTKPLKDFGITATNSADAMAQLRERTAGYAERDLDTLAGRLAQAKTNFGEVKEQIGSVLLGTDGLGAGVSGLSAFLADLASWIEENRSGFDELTGTLKVVGVAIVDAGSAVWGVIKGFWEAIDAIVGWGNVWRGVQIAVTLVSGVVQAFAGHVQSVQGKVTEALGGMLKFAAPVLETFGLNVKAAAENMLSVGKRLQAQGEKAATEAAEIAKDKILLIATSTETGQKKMTKATAEGAAERGVVIDRETKDEKAKREASGKALEELQRLTFKGQMQLVSTQQREYQELVTTFHEKMQKLDAADKAKAEELLKVAHGNLLQKWAGFGAQLQPTVVEPVNRIQHANELMVADMEDGVERIAAKTPKWTQIGQAMQDVGEETTRTAGRILDLADAFGISDARLESLAAGIGQLGDGLTRLGSGDVFGGITSGIMGVTSVLGGIFGDSPADKARKELLQKNNDRLAELRDKMGELLNIDTTGAKIEAFQGVDIGALVRATVDQRTGGIGIGQLGRFLGQQGLGLRDFEELAAQLGIDLGSDGKNFNLNAVVDLLQFVKQNRFTGFDDSIQGRLDRLDFETSMTGGGDQETIAGLARLFQEQGAAPAFGRLFTGINVGDGVSAIETEQLRARVVALGKDFAAGKVSEGDLGQLSNQEFRRLFERMVGLLESVSENTGAAADAGAATAAATSATASAISSGGMATLLDQQLADLATATTTNQGG